MWVIVMRSLVLWCAFASFIGGVPIAKRDVSELIGTSDQSQLVRTSSRLTNKYLPPQPSAELKHTHQLVTPVDINSKSGGIEPTTATSDVDNSRYENHSQTATNGKSQLGTNQLRAEFKTSDLDNNISTNGIPNGVSSSSVEFKSSEVDAPKYESQNQISGIPQTSNNQGPVDVNNSQYETQSQFSVNGEVEGRFRENGDDLTPQSKEHQEIELNNRDSESFLNYLPPQNQALSKPIRLSEKSGDVGATYVSSINEKPQFSASNPESYTFSSSNAISSEQQLPSRSSELNSFSPSPNPFKTYGPPSFQPQKSNYVTQRVSEDAAKNVNSFHPVPTEQTKLTDAGAQAYNYRVTLQNGQPSGYTSGSDVTTPQFSQQRTQFGYEVQNIGNPNTFNNLKPDSNSRYFQPQSNVAEPLPSTYQPNGQVSSSSQLIPSSAFSARFSENQNTPYLKPFRSSLIGPLTSVNGYRYQNPDLGIAVAGVENQQISDYQRRPDLTQNLGIASRLDFQIGVTPNLQSGANSNGAYSYVRPAIQNFEARLQPQGFSEVLQRTNQQDSTSGSFGVARSENLEDARLRTGSGTSYSISNGAYKYARPEIISDTQPSQQEVSQNQELIQRVNTFEQPDVRPAVVLGAQPSQQEAPQSQQLVQNVNTFGQIDSTSLAGGFGGEKGEDFSGQRGDFQQRNGQNYDSSGGYVY